MTIYLAGAILAGSAFILRELQALRERIQVLKSISQLRRALADTRNDIQRLSEEVYVMRALLVERNLVGEQDMAAARFRLIEKPRRQQEQRTKMSKHTARDQMHTVVGDQDGNMH